MTVYVVQKSGDETKVKIGTTRNMSHRMTVLSRSLGSIDLLGTMPGNEPTEKMIHRLFEDCRIEGEWFNRGDSINAFIAENFKIEVKRYVPKQRGWKSAAECAGVKSDLAIAIELLRRLFSGYPRTMTLAAILEEVYLGLAEINDAWTRRRVRAIHDGEARRIDLFEIKDMLTLLDVPLSEWGEVLAGGAAS